MKAEDMGQLEMWKQGGGARAIGSLKASVRWGGPWYVSPKHWQLPTKTHGTENLSIIAFMQFIIYLI